MFGTTCLCRMPAVAVGAGGEKSLRLVCSNKAHVGQAYCNCDAGVGRVSDTLVHVVAMSHLERIGPYAANIPVVGTA